MANTTTYSIELRDKNGKLRTYLTPFVTNCTWEWNRLGGCGRCSITLTQEYRKLDFGPRDDIQIRVKSGTTSKLVYRGWISEVIPSLKVSQTVQLDVKGYFDLLKMIVVHSAGEKVEYTNTEVSAVVTSIVDTFITPNTPITKGTIDVSNFSLDTLSFKDTVQNTLRTLAELQGDAEYGVDEDLVFFWRTESTTESMRFFVGNNISTLERRINWANLLNKIIFQGADVDDVAYIRTAEATDSQSQYYVSEAIVSNSAITTDTVADQYLSAMLKESSSPVYNIRAKILNTDIRLEDTIPMGEVVFYDSDHDQSLYTIGEVGDGGSDLTVGLTGDGGSNATIGGAYSAQVDRVSYSLSDTDGRFNIEIQMGDTILQTSAMLKRIENDLSNLRER
jgi:hypothetical protein